MQVVLTGGCINTPGFVTRFQTELRALVPSELEVVVTAPLVGQGTIEGVVVCIWGVWMQAGGGHHYHVPAAHCPLSPALLPPVEAVAAGIPQPPQLCQGVCMRVISVHHP